MSDVGGALAAMLGGGYVNYFSLSGRSYKVIPQVQQRFRLNAQQLLDYYIRTADGTPVPLSTVAHDHDQDGAGIAQSFPAAQQRDHPGRRPCPASRRATRCDYLKDLAARTLPQGYTVDYGGLSRQYVQEIERLCRHLRVRADHHLPGAGGAVRELPRSGDHSGVGADVDRRRADLHQPRHRRRRRSTSIPRSAW